MDDVKCKEKDNSITDCRFSLIDISRNCDHDDDIWLLCQGKAFDRIHVYCLYI